MLCTQYRIVSKYVSMIKLRGNWNHCIVGLNFNLYYRYFQPKLSMAKCRRNVENFLEACRKIGVDKVGYEVQNWTSLLQTGFFCMAVTHPLKCCVLDINYNLLAHVSASRCFHMMKFTSFSTLICLSFINILYHCFAKWHIAFILCVHHVNTDLSLLHYITG